MSSASARAEARRKAILSRGTDRLAKLTTSARGEDAPSYMKDPIGSSSSSTLSSSTRTFLGEDSSDMPAPSTFAPSPSPSPQPRSVFSQRTASSASATSATSSSTAAAASSTASTPPRPSHPQLNPFEAMLGGAGGPDPNVWSAEQQQQFMRALMAGGQTPLQSPLGDPTDPVDPTLPPLDNPLAAMLFGGGSAGGAGAGMGGPPGMDLASMFGGAPGQGMKVEPPKPEAKWAKYLPLLHLVVLWSVLAYFVFWLEPKVYDAQGFWGGTTVWERWASLAKRGAAGGAVGIGKKVVVQAAPFFWSFMTLQVALHSLQIFTNSNAVKPPALLSLALPHLPPPIPSLVVNSLKYWRMGSMFLDDVAGVVVGLGAIVYFSGYLG